MLCDITIVAICSMRATTITHVNEQIMRIFLPFLVCANVLSVEFADIGLRYQSKDNH